MRDEVARLAAAKAIELAKSAQKQIGVKGERGERGADGLPGRDGIDGRNGIDGKKGDRGEQGPIGPQGLTGPIGPIGPQGPKGDRGADGRNGKDGINGKDGKQGLTGPIGPMPKHEKKGLMIRFESEPGVWGKWITMPISGGGGGGRDDKLTDRQKELVEIGDLIRTQASNNNRFIKTVDGVLQWDTLDGSDINLSSPPAIGGTTPAAGTFTTLTATGQTSLGGAAGSETVRVLTGTNTGKYTVFEANTANNVQLIGAPNSANLGLYSTGGGLIRFYTASALQEQQFVVSRTASAVNYVQVTGAATGNAPTVSAQGSDSGINLNYASKGTYSSHIFTGTQGNQFQITGPADGSNSANRFIAYGGKTGTGVVLGSVGSDTNISQVFQSKGTGAIDLAAGSRGVNISNGGTVTAITRTAGGGSYTSAPTVAITAPTTAGGVQATATATISTTGTPTIVSGGTGYTVNDVLTIVGGTPISVAATMTVTAVSGGVITAASYTNFAQYTVAPTGTISVTGGTGSGAIFNISFAVTAAFTITNAGSGYVEQPTVTFSGGGGSGAAAYATVGGGAILRALGATGNQSLDIYTPSSITSSIPVFRFRDIAGGDSFTMAYGNSGYSTLLSQGNTNASLWLGANGTGNVTLTTGGGSQTNQLRVSHTASAVNYVQVTGNTTGNLPTISAQGSDANVSIAYQSKGTGSHRFLVGSGEALRIEQFGATSVVNRFSMFANISGGFPLLSTRGTDTNVGFDFSTQGTGAYRFYTNTASNGTGVVQFQVAHVASAANQLQVAGSAAGSAPILSAQGSDTNIDLTLTPKGTGLVRFGTYTANMALTVQGYIEIKDSGGTVRKLAVIA